MASLGFENGPLRMLTKKNVSAKEREGRVVAQFHLYRNNDLLNVKLGGGFKYFLSSPLLGEDSHFD